MKKLSVVLAVAAILVLAACGKKSIIDRTIEKLDDATARLETCKDLNEVKAIGKEVEDFLLESQAEIEQIDPKAPEADSLQQAFIRFATANFMKEQMLNKKDQPESDEQAGEENDSTEIADAEA